MIQYITDPRTSDQPLSFSRQIKPESYIFLTSGTCEATNHVGHKTLQRMGLKTGIVNGDHYPLTESEMQLIGEEYIPFGPQMAMVGYSVLMGGRKYLAPTIRLAAGYPLRTKCGVNAAP